jgi:histone H3/H4
MINNEYEMFTNADSLNLLAQQILKLGCERADSNQRKTVMAKDL